MEMYSLLCIILALNIVTSTITPAFPRDSDHLIILTDKTFQEAEDTYDFLFVVFYAPWCGMCEYAMGELLPHWPVLNEEFPNVGFAKYDGTEYKEFYYKYGANGYPTILLIAKGHRISEYTGSRKASAISEWLSERILPTILKVETEEELEKYQKKIDNKPLLVYFGYDFNEYNAFDSIANDYIKEIQCINIRDKKLMEKLNGKPRMFKLFKSFDEKTVELQGTDAEPIKLQKLEKWIQEYGHPQVMYYSLDVKNYIFDDKHSAMIFFEKNKDDNKALIEEFAKKTRSLIQTVVVDQEKGKYFSQSLNVEDIPSILLIDLRVHPKMFIVSPTFTKSADDLARFVESWSINKKIAAPIPIPSAYAKNVISVDERTFDKVVILNKRDVFVKFYAPWCGHCKALEPKYEELATKLANNEDLVLAEIDATMNNISGVNISGYPTLLFYPAGKKGSPIHYDGDHEVGAMEFFIKAHATNKVVDN